MRRAGVLIAALAACDGGEVRVAPSGETGDSADTGDSGWTLPERADLDHPSDADSWRWGGGEGCPDVVDPGWPVVTVVSDAPGLAAALAGATAGDVVYLDDAAEIDLTGAPVCVPGGVWLASGCVGSVAPQARSCRRPRAPRRR